MTRGGHRALGTAGPVVECVREQRAKAEHWRKHQQRQHQLETERHIANRVRRVASAEREQERSPPTEAARIARGLRHLIRVACLLGMPNQLGVARL